MSRKELILTVLDEDEGLRLDQYLVKTSPQKYSRSFFQKLIHQGLCLVNGKRSKPNYLVNKSDKIELELETPLLPKVEPEKIPLEIIFEDDDILVVNKPEGMVTHPAAGNFHGTLVNGLVYYSQKLSDLNGPLRLGIVHRLDKATSGLLVVARNNLAHQALANQFKEHSVKRKYIAVVKGKLEHDEGLVDVPIGRDHFNRKKMKAKFVDGKTAKTYYRVIKRNDKFTTLEIFPQTGRTHQIRVHLSFLGHPILGDKRYGEPCGFSRLLLHACQLGFIHPRTKREMNFESPLPREFEPFL